MRAKRPDTRPNEKQRRKISAKAESEKTIQDLRVTRKRKSEHLERIVDRNQPLVIRTKKTDETDKIIKALKKKLKAIDELISKEKRGEVLDEQQRAKIGRLDEVMSEMSEALSKYSPENPQVT